jgi:hypothetical protein
MPFLERTKFGARNKQNNKVKLLGEIEKIYV